MSLPGVDGLRLLGSPSGGPVATATAVREADGVQVRIMLITAELDQATIRRVRAESAQLEAILVGIDPDVVLPLLDHGADDLGRPYLLAARPGPDVTEVLAVEGPLPVPMIVAAARAAADGLEALAANGIVGCPPALVAYGSRRIAMSPPLPPVLAELEATQGEGTGHEPPEVLGGADWTPAGQVYACASLFWTLLCGLPPYAGVQGGTALARLVSKEPPLMPRPGIPEEIVAVLRRALSSVPASRYATPAELATALRDAVARPLGSLYLLDTQIGQGACGQVWAGRRRSGGDPIAVKLLRAELVEGGMELGRFVREYHVLHRLRHPHLVRVDEFFGEGGVYAIIMDLVQGGNLRHFAARRRLSVAEAASLLAQTAGGLAAVHEAGLVHRDVKPENVLVAQRDGRPVALLSDFGIARPHKGSEHTQILGTPSYLAPELVAGRPPGPEADVYALGVMAYELLAGRKPFYGSDTDSLLLAHLDQLPVRPDGMPDEAWGLIAACLDKDPQARPTAAQVAMRCAGLADSDPLRYIVSGPSTAPAGTGRLDTTPPPAGTGRPDTPPPTGMGRLDTPPPSEVDDESLTILSSRPAAPRPEDPAPRRRWRRLLAAGIAATLAGLALGIYIAAKNTARDTSSPPSAPAAQFQYPVTAAVAVNDNVAIVSWGADAAKLPGFEGYLVFDYYGDRLRPLNDKILGADVTSFEVGGLRAGRGVCFYVIAVGVTVAPPQTPPPLPCVTVPTSKPTSP